MPSRLRTALRWAVPLPALTVVALTGGLVAALLLTRGAGWPARVYAVGVAAAGVWTCAVLVRFAGDEPWPRSRPARLELDEPERPAELSQIERGIRFALDSGFDFHHRVRPLLRSIAEVRLSVRHGIDLDAEPEAARGALGDDVFAALQPPAGHVDHGTDGVGLEELERIVAALEGL